MYQDSFILYCFFDHFHDNIFYLYLYADNMIGRVGIMILLQAAKNRLWNIKVSCVYTFLQSYFVT